jgi:UDP:flavonoid glycosyltransferase YjiC (YdhE family)
MATTNSKQKPLVGFFPSADNLAEYGRAVMIAKRFKKLGGNVIFFSHGRKYEFLIRKNGFKLIKVEPTFTEELLREWSDIASLEKIHPKNLIEHDWFFENVKEEIKAFKKTGIDLLVSTNCITCSISARAANIPYINIKPGAGKLALDIPDSLKNGFTRLIPRSISRRFVTWYIRRTKFCLRPINKIAKEFGVPPFKRSIDLWKGDITLLTSSLEFINVFQNQQILPTENYVGMILPDEIVSKTFSNKEEKEIESEIKAHLKRPGKSILLTLGSSGKKEFFIKLIETLNKTDYNVIAIYTSVLNEEDIQKLKLKDNILMLKFVPSIGKINRMVDLAIVHGGQGTVYTAAYSKKPIIGFPMIYDQHLNLEKLVGHGVGIMLSKKYFTEKKLLNAINEIFNNYNKYLDNANKLADKIPPPMGDKNTAKIIMRVLEEKNLT